MPPYQWVGRLNLETPSLESDYAKPKYDLLLVCHSHWQMQQFGLRLKNHNTHGGDELRQTSYDFPLLDCYSAGLSSLYGFEVPLGRHMYRLENTADIFDTNIGFH